MENDWKGGCLFLGAKPRSNRWALLKKRNCEENIVGGWTKEMARFVGILKDVTNKNGRMILVTKVAISQIPQEIVTRITSDKNLKN